ncbi:MAG: hypothetical protein M0Z54_05600 [Thermaerobacter sp.]|nr:hypothetical protein [Thermaerobacter sp.]
MAHRGLEIAFAAGLGSFVSPWVVPLVPSYLSALATTALGPGQPLPGRPRVFAHALVLVASGLAATSLGAFLASHQHVLAQLGGLIMVVFGLELAGAIHIGLLSRTAMWRGPRVSGLWAAVLLGVVFAFGWTRASVPSGPACWSWPSERSRRPPGVRCF